MAEKDIYERAAELGRSGRFKKVRTDGKTIEVKPLPPDEQQFRPLREGER